MSADIGQEGDIHWRRSSGETFGKFYEGFRIVSRLRITDLVVVIVVGETKQRRSPASSPLCAEKLSALDAIQIFRKLCSGASIKRVYLAYFFPKQCPLKTEESKI